MTASTVRRVRSDARVPPRWEEFRASLADLAAASQLSYTRKLLRFYRDNPGYSMATVTAAQVQAYFDRPEVQQKSQTTRNVQLIALRRYFDVLVAAGTRTSNPAKEVRLRRPMRRLPRPASRTDVALVMQQFAMEPLTLVALQDRAILETLYGSGLRRLEAAMLSLGDVSPTQLRIVGKGGKERVTIVSDRQYLALRSWILAYYRDAQTERLLREDGPDAAFLDLISRRPTDPVFVGLDGTPMRDRYDPGHYIWLRVQAVTEAVGLRLTPHQLRHSFATHMLGNGADLLAVRDVLGHADVKTTAVYTLLDDTRLARLRTLHPRST